MNHSSADEWLPYYLRDHLAGARAGVNFFTRVANGHTDEHVRTEIAKVRDEVQHDYQAISGIMTDLGVRHGSVTMFLGVFGELAGRLKPNGALFKRSAGADVLELEALTAAVQAKARLWETLLVLADTNPQLDAKRLHRLQDQAEKQRDTIIALHRHVVRTLAKE